MGLRRNIIQQGTHIQTARPKLHVVINMTLSEKFTHHTSSIRTHRSYMPFILYPL